MHSGELPAANPSTRPVLVRLSVISSCLALQGY
jgi:hypothetical protein